MYSCKCRALHKAAISTGHLSQHSVDLGIYDNGFLADGRRGSFPTKQLESVF